MNNSYNPHIVFFKTANEKSSPFMQFNLQDLKTCPKTPLSSMETLRSTMEIDITQLPINLLLL